MNIPILPEQASLGAREVDHLTIALCILTAFFVAITAGPILYFAFKYRRGRVVDRRHGPIKTLRFEVTWTIMPVILALGLFAWSAKAYFEQRHAPVNAMEIHVIGKQWMWKAQHPQGKREINALHLPVGVPVKMLMTSQDVIHSFFIPAFRMKQDVLPHRYTTEWMVPTKIGTYHLFCAEYCGTDHSRMIGTVTVMSKAEYEQWLTTGEQAESPVLAGARLFQQLGCSGCHVGSNVVRAPQLTGVYGSVVPLQDGRSVIADERYLRDSILLPGAEIVAGYDPVMPSFQGRISEEELMALTAYLKSIGQKEGGGAP